MDGERLARLLMLSLRLIAFFLLCISEAAYAAVLTEADAIAVAKKYCAKQIPGGSALRWNAFLVDGTWAVGATPGKNQASEGWVFSIPAQGPVPKHCVHYTVK